MSRCLVKIVRAMSMLFPVLGVVLLYGCGDLRQLPTEPAMNGGGLSGVEQVAGIPDRVFQSIAFVKTTSEEIRASKSIGSSKSKSKKRETPQVDTRPAYVSEWIFAEKGGRVLLDWESKDKKGGTGAQLKAKLTILPGALTQDTQISIGLLRSAYKMLSMDLEFGKHGTVFQIPAEIKLNIEGLDLSSFEDENQVDLYWYDPDADAWFPIRSEKKKVELDKGKIQGTWYLDHFSRYSLGGGGW